MYAVVESGGKQYRVSVGESLRVEKLTSETGEIVQLGRVLFLSDADGARVGNPVVEGAIVKAEVLGHGRDKKIQVFKMKRRKKYRRSQGHRQAFTQVRVTEING